ncbi:unnamed protein product [Cyclocybe aegerita]|uniref:C2H2-type domain-containing protein n=1 Tax=Cyclocybe aegerita TaxID=1973307 RepID=A0A8S0X2B1_CYCAE|nr:unnamed protein product [Cyclocybe aegerita]
MVRANPTPATVSVWKPAAASPAPADSDEPQSPRIAGQPDDRRDASLKKRSRKKTLAAGSWPCKINGCNKQFAREADLKRHQRTTKLHSMPSFACPQCDNTFTRTDALRRHQKSRHDGVIIEPVEQTGDENADTRSRSGTPSSKGKERATNIPVQTHQGTPIPTGPSSYYRSHTATISPFIPVHLQATQTTLPVSSTRTGPPWPTYPTNWTNGSLPPNMGPISYIPQSTYYPSPHYRPHTSSYPTTNPPSKPLQPLQTQGNGSLSVPNASSQVTPASRNPPQPPESSSRPPSAPSMIPGIDPEITAEDIVNAVEAVLRQADLEAAKKKEREEQEKLERERQTQNTDPSMDGVIGDDLDSHRSFGLEDGLDGMPGYGSSFERPEPMEHMLTEDGEPMLNPAELLTQESLASPPPS